MNIGSDLRQYLCFAVGAWLVMMLLNSFIIPMIGVSVGKWVAVLVMTVYFIAAAIIKDKV